MASILKVDEIQTTAGAGFPFIPMIDVWNLTSAHSNSGDITSGWARMNTDSPGLIGTGMSEHLASLAFQAQAFMWSSLLCVCQAAAVMQLFKQTLK